jgi:hypothetical protein
MKKKATLIILVILGAVALGAALSWRQLFPALGTNAAGAIPCINPNRPLSEHIHTKLIITVDGRQEQLHGDIGRSATCDQYLHTHDDPGDENLIHVETQGANIKRYTLGDFYSVWGQSIARPGFTLEAKVNGILVFGDPAALQLHDLDEISLSYFSISISTATIPASSTPSATSSIQN